MEMFCVNISISCVCFFLGGGGIKLQGNHVAKMKNIHDYLVIG